jgi:hypothetical protein
MLAAVDLEEVFREILKHPILTIAILAWIGGAFARKFKGAQVKQGEPRGERRPPRRDPAERDESELEARVRRNFEEMMRRRAAASSPPSAAPAKAAAPSRARKVVDYDERARPEPTSTEGPRRKPAAAAAAARKKEPAKASGASAHVLSGTVRSAAAGRLHHRQRALDLRRVALDPRTLRRTILLREVLDPPIALRG